jgi:hypothetical protein
MANFTTSDPEGKNYTFYFTKKIISFESNDKPIGERVLSYEKQLTAFLHRDSNTITCLVVPESIDFGEPGSGGSARVRCKSVPPFEIDPTSFTLERKPIYRYWVQGHGGI